MSDTKTQSEVMLSTADLSKRFEVTERTIQRWLSQSLLPPPLRIGRRYLRWRLSEIERFENGQ